MAKVKDSVQASSPASQPRRVEGMQAANRWRFGRRQAGDADGQVGVSHGWMARSASVRVCRFVAGGGEAGQKGKKGKKEEVER